VESELLFAVCDSSKSETVEASSTVVVAGSILMRSCRYIYSLVLPLMVGAVTRGFGFGFIVVVCGPQDERVILRPPLLPQLQLLLKRRVCLRVCVCLATRGNRRR
jgi:hypothetical protein